MASESCHQYFIPYPTRTVLPVWRPKRTSELGRRLEQEREEYLPAIPGSPSSVGLCEVPHSGCRRRSAEKMASIISSRLLRIPHVSKYYLVSYSDIIVHCTPTSLVLFIVCEVGYSIRTEVCPRHGNRSRTSSCLVSCTTVVLLYPPGMMSLCSIMQTCYITRTTCAGHKHKVCKKENNATRITLTACPKPPHPS